MRNYLGKAVTISLLSSTAFLAGCGSGNYKTESGHSITMDEVRAYKANQRAFPLPYRLGEYTYNFSDPEQANNKYMQDYADKIERSGGKVLNQWLDPNSESSLDLNLNTHKPKTSPPFALQFINAFFSVFTLGIIPLVASGETESDLELVSDGKTIHTQRTKVSGSGTVSILVPWGYIFGHNFIGNDINTEAYKIVPLIAHEEHLVRAINREKPIYERIKNSQDPQQLAQAVNKLSFYKPLVIERLASLLGQRKDRLAQYQLYMQKLPEFKAYIPKQDQIYFVGPEKFNVLDVIKKSRANEDKALLATLIKSSGQPYKQFSTDEILRLNKLGLSGEVIQAMMQAGRNSVTAQPAVQQPSKASAYAAPAGARQVAGAPSNANQPPPNKVAECAKALAAKKACEHTPGPFGIGVKICMKGVKDKFGGYGCPIGF